MVPVSFSRMHVQGPSHGDLISRIPAIPFLNQDLLYIDLLTGKALINFLHLETDNILALWM